MKSVKSIMDKKKQCYFCGSRYMLEKHHVFNGPNRNLSEEHGLTVMLCLEHHRGNNGVHSNNQSTRMLKQAGQRAFEKSSSREEFMEIFGKNYLD